MSAASISASARAKRINWSEAIADPVIADAIRDRLQHSALTINITGESYRGVNARNLASTKKDA